MKKTKWLTALVIAAAALTSNVANAGVFNLGSTDSIGKLLMDAGSSVMFTLTFERGSSFDITHSDGVTVNQVLNSEFGGTVFEGSMAFNGATNGWLSVTPVGNSVGLMTWNGNGITAAVPEPEVYALMGLGVAGLLLSRRRQKRNLAV